MKHKLFTKADLIIISLLLIISLALILPGIFSKKSLTAEIYRGGEKIQSIDLSAVNESYEIKLDGATILVEKNAVSFKDADCPDKLCVGCGVLNRIGDTAVCVPTSTVIRITGNGASEIDAISY